MEPHYNSLNTKFDCLQAKQRRKTKTRHNNQEQQFYPKNLTNIKFNKKEMDLLNHGLQHSTERPLKTYWTNLKVQTERAIKLFDTKLQITIIRIVDNYVKRY